jgi:DNA-binding LacI/PurR family transcriptional regulator
MAQESIKELNSLMSSREPMPAKKIFLPTELIIRESCRPLPVQLQ